MKAAKGGGGIASVIVQEGVPSMVTSDGATAEPAIYMLGCKLAGGFLRAHEKKAADESLNSPGAVYKRLCVSDLRVNVEGHPMENVYGWVARLSLLAVSQEMKSEQVELRSYELGPDC
jgi:glutamate--cysteine ligase